MTVQLPLTGSYSSAGPVPLPLTTSTCPFGSNAAVCPERGVVMLPVAVHIIVAGSYSSALAITPWPPMPPATSTCPFGSNVAVCPKRGTSAL